MITFVQSSERVAHSLEIYEFVVKEGGYARITISIIGLLLLIKLFRSKELWVWISLFLILVLYVFPVFVYPFSIPSLKEFLDLGQLRSSWLARFRFEAYTFCLLMVVGLGMFLPSIFRRKGPS